MGFLKTTLALVLLVAVVKANERAKRQAGQYGGAQAQAQAYRPQQQQPLNYQQQQQEAYQQQQAYNAQQQYAPQQQQRRPAKRPSKYQEEEEEEEKEQGPHPLQLLLENSKFECGNKGDGYYADSDVGCRAFHYCVSGQKHSMMCPEATVFHQVHLNCVPADQDICSKANKFYFVNNYLNKPLEQRGPNNTIVYAPRYYPKNYAVGDDFIPPQDENKDQRDPPAATYGLGPAYREQGHQQGPAYQQQAPAYQQQPPAYQQAPTPQRQQVRPAQYAQAPQPAAYRQQPQPRPQQPQPVMYGYGAQQQQAYQAQAQQAQRAYAQQQYQAAQPQQQYQATQPQQQYQAQPQQQQQQRQQLYAQLAQAQRFA